MTLFTFLLSFGRYGSIVCPVPRGGRWSTSPEGRGGLRCERLLKSLRLPLRCRRSGDLTELLSLTVLQWKMTSQNTYGVFHVCRIHVSSDLRVFDVDRYIGRGSTSLCSTSLWTLYGGRRGRQWWRWWVGFPLTVGGAADSGSQCRRTNKPHRFPFTLAHTRNHRHKKVSCGTPTVSRCLNRNCWQVRVTACHKEPYLYGVK